MFLGNLEEINRVEFEKIINEKNHRKRIISNKIIEDFIIFGYEISNVYFINCFIDDISDTKFNNCIFDNCVFHNLYHVIAEKCKFSCSNFRNCFIRHSCFNETRFIDCDFFNSTIKNTEFNDIKSFETSFLHLQCPEEGSFIGYKKLNDKYKNCYICKLLIPEDAKRSSSTSRKCRCSYAKVLEITNIETGENVLELTHYNMTIEKKLLYKVGEFVYPDGFDDNRFNECSNGIHFFITKKEALEY